MNNDCVFCKIAANEIPATKIYEDEEFCAFKDANPQAPVHFLVIPKKHIANIMEKDASPEVLGKLLSLARALAVEQGMEEKGCRFVINCKDNGGQTVPHLHVHVLGGRFMDWPPG
jgi:histidine triad (HIT) family protein